MALSEKTKKSIAIGTICTIIVGSVSGIKYKVNKENPFNENEIVCSDFLADIKIKKAVDDIFDDQKKLNIKEMSDSELKAYLLYDAVNTNPNLMAEEKQKFVFLIDEWKNNEYLDYESLYERLKTLKIERDVYFIETNILEQYDRENNTIRICEVDKNKYKSKEEQEERKEQILNRTTHEGCHVTRTSDIKPGEEWLEEAYCSIIDAESTGFDWDYRLCTNTIRFICEILGKDQGADIIRQARQEGDVNVLTSALVNKGIPKELCIELYEIEEEYKELTQVLSSDSVKEKRLDLSNKAANILAQMYDISNEYPEKETYNVKILLSFMMSDTKLDMSKYKFYYFNSENKSSYSKFVMEDGNYVIYYEDFTMYEYKIDENKEKVLISADRISDRSTLDKALNYLEEKERK